MTLVLVVDNPAPDAPSPTVCEAGPEVFAMTAPTLGDAPVSVVWRCLRCGRMAPPAYGAARDLSEVAALAFDQWVWSGPCEGVVT